MNGDTHFDLRQMYNQAFGPIGFLELPPYIIESNAGLSKPHPFDPIKSGLRQGKEGLYGTVIQMPCTLDGYDLPNEPLIEINGTKNIITTTIDGNDGTFKELYSLGDYEVTIRGVAINDDDPDNYPTDIVRRIRKVAESKKHIEVVNALTTLFGITHLAVMSYQFPAIPGSIGMQPYELRCLSDREFNLKAREQ